MCCCCLLYDERYISEKFSNILYVCFRNIMIIIEIIFENTKWLDRQTDNEEFPDLCLCKHFLLFCSKEYTYKIFRFPPRIHCIYICNGDVEILRVSGFKNVFFTILYMVGCCVWSISFTTYSYS